MFRSFSDANGGIEEELSEINICGGLEYWYKKIVALRDKYVEKIFKHIGKSVSNKFKNSKSYKISLITVLPVSIWNKKKIEKNIVYVEKIYWYDVT